MTIIPQNYSLLNESALFEDKKQFQSEKSKVRLAVARNSMLQNWCHLFLTCYFKLDVEIAIYEKVQ